MYYIYFDNYYYDTIVLPNYYLCMRAIKEANGADKQNYNNFPIFMSR